MSDRQSVSQWLRTPKVYADDQKSPGDNRWREALLSEFDANTSSPPRAAANVADDGLKPRHILVMMPVGVALYFGGWLVGRGAFSLQSLAALPPMIWVILAVGGGLAFMLKRGLKFGRWS